MIHQKNTSAYIYNSNFEMVFWPVDKSKWVPKRYSQHWLLVALQNPFFWPSGTTYSSFAEPLFFLGVILKLGICDNQ